MKLPFRSRAVSIVAVVGLGVAYACSHVDSPTDPSISSWQPGVRLDQLSDERNAYIENVKVKVAFAGRIHNKAMADLRAFYAANPAAVHDRAAACAQMARIVMSNSPEMIREAGVTLAQSDLSASVRAALSRTSLCRGISVMSVFGAATANRAALVMDGEDDVTGEFEYYLNSLTPAVQYAGAAYSSLESNVNGVLAAASAIPYNDFQVVATGAGLTTSSAEYWGNVDATGGGPGGEDPMSVFPLVGVQPIWGIVAIDLIGCAAGIMSAHHAGQRSWRYLAVECFIWGAAASLAGAIPM